MKQRLSTADTIGLGLMTFAFFLGAGNIIFPPFEGQQAGANFLFTMGGFLLTAVGLPLLAIIAVSRAGGGLPSMTNDLPKGTGLYASILIFIIIGPAFAVPRTALVSYTIAIQPLVSLWTEAKSQSIYLSLLNIKVDTHQILSSIIFFILTVLFSWSRGKLIGYIGKFLTPILFILLVCLAVGAVVDPQSAIIAPVEGYKAASDAFAKGFIGGYGTMDTFASLMFGILLVDILRAKGITEARPLTRYLSIAGIIAAVGLSFVYISLFWIGATSFTVAPNAGNGAVVLAAYVHSLFGEPGQLILSCVVYLACLTTAVGVLSACADYFSSIISISYRAWIVILCVISTVVTNIGLDRLIQLSVPVLLALYPMAISLVVLTLIRHWFSRPRVVYRSVMVVALFFSLLDVCRQLNIEILGIPSLLKLEQQYIPLASSGMAWCLPTFLALLIAARPVDKNRVAIAE